MVKCACGIKECDARVEVSTFSRVQVRIEQWVNVPERTIGDFKSSEYVKLDANGVVALIRELHQALENLIAGKEDF